MATRAQIMDFVEKQCSGAAYRKDIIKFIVEMNGKKYHPVLDRGYYSCAFWKSTNPKSFFKASHDKERAAHKIGYLLEPSYRGDKRYLRKNPTTGKYELLYA